MMMIMYDYVTMCFVLCVVVVAEMLCNAVVLNDDNGMKKMNIHRLLAGLMLRLLRLHGE